MGFPRLESALDLPYPDSIDLPARDDDLASERELVERARTDRAAFAQLYRATYPLIVAHVHRRTGDAQATEEIVSDVFFTILRRLDSFRWRGLSFRHWALRLASRAVSRRARARRRYEGLVARTADRLEEHIHGDDVDRRRSELAAALATLPGRFQSVLALHHLDELPLADVARILGCRVGTVKSRLSRARAALRQALDRSNPESTSDREAL